MGYEKCFIIGAGASFGYNEAIPKCDRVPRTQEVLLWGKINGLLLDDYFPNLISVLSGFLRRKGRNTEDYKNIDIEEFLQNVGDEWASLNAKFEYGLDANSVDPAIRKEIQDNILSNVQDYFNTIRREHPELVLNDDRKRAATLQSCLGETWFFLFELFRRNSIAYRANFDSYQRLALHHLGVNYGVISLNYDVIFEMAIQNSALSYRYPPFTPNSMTQLSHYRVIDIAKVHGSINWLNAYGKGIALGGMKLRGSELLKKVSGFIFSNRVNTTPLININPQSLANLDFVIS